MKLTIESLVEEARLFCDMENLEKHPQLTGISDGKAIGTYIEQEFKDYLSERYSFNQGSCAHGIDFPDEDINTDIKVTSSKKPQNSCPFTDIRQKIYGLGYNILLFVYDSNIEDYTDLKFESCTFIKASETGDYNLTRNLIKMVENKWDADRITEYLIECKMPGNYNSLNELAHEIIENPPRQGYLTISNALQWRLKYSHVNKKKEEEMKSNSKKEYGDYQTPQYFANKVVKYVKEKLEYEPDLIIEPTCGVGNFIKACRKYYSATRIVGIDINEEYLNEIGATNNLQLYHGNIFDLDFNRIKIDDDTKYLIIGNPPWVTNTRLSKYESDNIPEKNNYKHLEYFDAITGESNFDISEHIILSLIDDFNKSNAAIVFLCKYSVACNIFKHLAQNKIRLANVQIIKFDSMKVFKADTTSCILIMEFNDDGRLVNKCNVSNMDNPKENYTIGVIDDKFYSNTDNMVDIDGICSFEWRQGIKHDCVKVMELKKVGDKYENKKDERVYLEENLLYPLLKSSNLKKPIVTDSNYSILLTQHRLKEDTSYIKDEYPLTWKYLDENRELFANRKSSIYRRCPEFSIFGIGKYAFRPYKVAISGFYKKGLFSLVYNDEKSMMLDDTCYYISFDDYDSAYITMLILNSNLVQNFLKSIVVIDSKRPYTKKVLKRIDIIKTLKKITINDLIATEKDLKLDGYITRDKFEKYYSLYG
ncbi:class I SAM-dependent methyltransferase [Methanosphaera sp. BMS]|uniref:class I SAM-dependent methyltransferase n=1 Tax=Methanosphaera sp. BMS TaxID=1789762 RepID=UPI000DC1C84E|nr:class I SAM-dependent methyltransferase [Methanosphaera sp. BMS]AWX32642.1 hypothetical protein AW729_05825 [Methanosphaera sp. BMS]